MRTPEEKYKRAIKILQYLLRQSAKLDNMLANIDADYWDNMIYAGDLLNDLEMLEFKDIKDKLMCMCALWEESEEK